MTTVTPDRRDGVALEPPPRMPFGPVLAAVALVVGATGNLAQTVLWQLWGGRPDTFEGQLAWAQDHPAHFVATCLLGTLAVPFMAIGFVAAARLLAARSRWTGIVAGALLVLAMWGFQVIQAAETIQLAAMLDSDGASAARWMYDLAEQPLLLVFGAPFLLGAPLGLLVLTIGCLVTGAIPRWIATAWLVFVVLDFGMGALGPVDPHWLYFVGAVGLARLVLREPGVRA